MVETVRKAPARWEEGPSYLLSVWLAVCLSLSVCLSDDLPAPLTDLVWMEREVRASRRTGDACRLGTCAVVAQSEGLTSACVIHPAFLLAVCIWCVRRCSPVLELVLVCLLLVLVLGRELVLLLLLLLLLLSSVLLCIYCVWPPPAAALLPPPLCLPPRREAQEKSN